MVKNINPKNTDRDTVEYFPQCGITAAYIINQSDDAYVRTCTLKVIFVFHLFHTRVDQLFVLKSQTRSKNKQNPSGVTLFSFCSSVLMEEPIRGDHRPRTYASP